jgi:hypothetical protein
VQEQREEEVLVEGLLHYYMEAILRVLHLTQQVEKEVEMEEMELIGNLLSVDFKVR